MKPIKNIKAICSSIAVQKEVVGQPWPMCYSLPTTELRHCTSIDTPLLPLTVFFNLLNF